MRGAVVGRRRYPLWRAFRFLARPLLSRPAGLAALNGIYRALTLRQKRRFLAVFGGERVAVDGRWAASFGGKPVLLPLRRDLATSWLLALSFEGQEVEVRSFFEALLRSPRRPRLVFDVGAYCGLHTLKFLVHGIRAIAFEPNAACQGYLAESCRLNGVACEFVPVALADRPGRGQLFVPRDEPYLATTFPDVAGRFGEGANVAVLEVRQLTLDGVVREQGLIPDLVKIDAEGREADVLRGGLHLLETRRPVLVFECWPDAPARREVFALLDALGYRVHPLHFPWRRAPTRVSREGLVASRATNYAAWRA